MALAAVHGCDDGEEGTYRPQLVLDASGFGGEGGLAGYPGIAGDFNGPPCILCGPTLINVSPPKTCKDNGPPSSYEKVYAWQGCMCKPENCLDKCVTPCSTFSPPDDACMACVTDKCAKEVQACVADDGTPTNVDAGSDANVDATADAPPEASTTDAGAD